MIGISKLFCDTVEASDPLRYGRRSAALPSHLLQFSQDKKPVLVWNLTRACNLSCRHCYASASPSTAADELRPDEARRLLDELLDYGAPVILFSGGEPLLHPQLFELVERAVRGGARAVLSSNGLMLDKDKAARLKDLGLSYVGLSLDGLKEAHDELRSRPGAFEGVLKAAELALKAGLKVGLRLTLNQRNVNDLGAVFELMAQRGIPRICFYHLVFSGRGRNLETLALDHGQSRAAVDFIAEQTRAFHQKGLALEVLTVDNHADGPYLYLKLMAEGRRQRAAEVLELLRLNGGNSSGCGIGSINWNGEVYPDQFWRSMPLGSVRKNSFASIWDNRDNEVLMALKNKKEHVKGRCRACCFLDVCGGNLRARAHAATGDIWGQDPACYLSNEEIARLPQ